ncbi:MAG: ABC transporter permease [Verrucomicrobia bacterium]|nr:ABC transporter permease [Verrucomicrobiota bacterium]
MILSLIKKELLALLRDKKSRISILLPPLVQLTLFASAATLDVKNVPIGILNRDSGEEAFELVQRFHGSPFFTKIIYLQSVEEIAPFIDNQRGVMVLSIDEEFSRKLDKKEEATIQVILDGRKSNTAQIVAGYTSQIVLQYNEDFKAKADLVEENSILMPRSWFNPNLLYVWYNIPCLVAILSMLTCLVVTTQSVARERELGTFDQLLVSPLTVRQIVIGKIVPGIIVGTIEGTIMLICGIFLFKVPFTGSFLYFFCSLVVFVWSVSGIGLFISSLSRTQQQAMLGTFIFMMPAVLLSGFATPIENMPTLLQPVTYLIPLRYMLLISKGLFLKDIPLLLVLERVWPMVVIGICNTIGASLLFRRRMA